MKKRVYLLLSLLLISSVLVAGTGAYLKYGLFASLGLETEENILSLPFVLLADEQLSYSVSYRLEARQNPPQTTEAPETTVPTEETTEATEITEAASEATEPIETEPPYIPVDESWFDDALFIGESRTAALMNFGRLGTADYFCGVNQTVYEITAVHKSDLYFSHKTLKQLLSEKTYGKIFIHFGINESAGDIEMFISAYQGLIDMIRELQPDAYIILQAIMPVTRGYATRPIFLPENLNMMNSRIQALATDNHFRYIDVREWIADEEGFMLEEYTNDGCHPHADGCQKWAEWLIEKAGWLQIP